MKKTAKYNIGAVSKLTGISPYNLRAWERRYGIEAATKSETGRRLYSEEDVQKLMFLKHLTDRGNTISAIAGLSRDELEERVRQEVGTDSDMTPVTAIAPHRVAVFGQYLPAILQSLDVTTSDVEVLTVASEFSPFLADIGRIEPDVVVLEFSILDDDAVAKIDRLRQNHSDAKLIVVYKYGRQTYRKALSELSLLAKSPINAAEIVGLIRSVSVLPRRTRGHETSHNLAGATSRMFTPAQLSLLAQASTSVECECPKHLVDLIRDLSAFEAYSQQCESRDDGDAALHGYLNDVSAQARHVMEQALHKVVVAEGLEQLIRGS